MKNLNLLALAGLVLFSCSQPTSDNNSDSNEFVLAPADSYPGKIAGSTIYEVNIRQHTPEGTFNAFAEDLPRLKDLGVEVLWLMPINPISEKNRKGPLGSYYAVGDYKAVNPEFGTDEDFQNLVNKIHDLGMYVILDWVPNHTGWDHPWIESNPDFYTKDENGNITYEADWTDIALLNHYNEGTRDSMIASMKYWVTEFDIDGFRQDHAAHEIPLFFWEEATRELEPLKDLLWLAEWDGARMHKEFHITYAWPLMHLQNEVAKGEKNAHDIEQYLRDEMHEYCREPFRMTIATNHDENSWNGTVFERYGEGHQTFATFIFTAYGIPMLYSGQEVGLDERLKFFEKDTINWSDPLKLQPFYKSLVSLHKENQALWAGQFGGTPVRINSDDWIYAFKREKEGNQVIGILNFSDKNQALNLTDTSVSGTYTDYFTKEKFTLGSDPLVLSPWQYLIFVSNE
ncbi:MAG: alpha-amylase family glycosyl hydrolase [Cyclobacteriaceae bacterium]